MPIRAENRSRYPANWKAIRAAILARAGNRCEGCGVRNGATIYRGTHGGQKAWRYRGDSVFCPSRRETDGAEIPGSSWDDFATAARPIRIVLTVAHLDHQPENCAFENLRAWCQRCHNAHDAPMRAAGVRSRRQAGCAVGDLFKGSPDA